MIGEAHHGRIVARNAPAMAEGRGALIELRLHRRREREHGWNPLLYDLSASVRAEGEAIQSTVRDLWIASSASPPRNDGATE
jgi:hypothetical protein